MTTHEETVGRWAEDLMKIVALRDDEWASFHADEIKASGKRKHLCRICKTVRIPALVHACALCD